MGAVDDDGPSGGAARALDRSFDTFRTGIGKEHLVQIGNVIEQTFRQHPGQGGHVELHQIGEVAVEDALQGGGSAGWFRPIAKTPKPLSRSRYRAPSRS